MDVIKLYKSQFYNPESKEPKTLISEKRVFRFCSQ